MSLTAALISLQRVKTVTLLFVPDKAFTNESWRIFTSFCVSKGISLDLLMEIFYIRSSCGRVEDVFSTTHAILPERTVDGFDDTQRHTLRLFMDRNRAVDFLYFFIQVAASVLVAATVLYYRAGVGLFSLGHLLCRVFMYIDSQNSPHAEMDILGLFAFRRMYFPWVTALVDLVPNRAVREDVVKLVVLGDMAICGNPKVWFYFTSIALGHFWWTCRELVLSNAHYDDDDQRRGVKRNALLRYGVYKIDVAREFLMWLFIPPWYWVILAKIKNRR